MKPFTLKLFLFPIIGLLITLLSACDSQPVKQETDDKLPFASKPPATEQQATLTEEAEELLLLAEASDSQHEQHDYRLQAAQLYLQAGEVELARHQHELLTLNSSERLRAEPVQDVDIQLLGAQIAVAEKNTPLAIELIDQVQAISREQQIRYHNVKADIDYLAGRYYFAIDRRVQLSSYLIDQDEKNHNNTRIWAALSSMSSPQLSSHHSSNLTIKGWLNLAKVVRSAQQDVSQLEDDLLDWGTRYPNHPANDSFLVTLVDDYQDELSGRKHIALILPLQGSFSTLSNTIKNGFLSAYYNDTNNPAKPQVSFYDSSDGEYSFDQLYQQAIADGATNIIGPLNKTTINQLSLQPSLSIPVLTLNYSENPFSYTENLYQFGLSPEDEARQVAELAIAQNKMKAAVFYPDSDWGKRLQQAFTEHYEFLGGQVLSTADYVTTTNDYTRPIRSLFNLDQSDIRHRKIENLIGAKAKSEPRRRQDIDMIFLAATHRSARSIMPAFKFHRASDLPVYSTSHVYTGKLNRDQDRDLNGLVFCDLPWVLKNSSPLEKVFTSNWPEQQALTRLFAFGVDAYHLIYNLDYLDNRDYAFYPGQTGNIQFNENNRITRKLLWARFKNGRAVYFEPEISLFDKQASVGTSQQAAEQATANN